MNYFELECSKYKIFSQQLCAEYHNSLVLMAGTVFATLEYAIQSCMRTTGDKTCSIYIVKTLLLSEQQRAYRQRPLLRRLKPALQTSFFARTNFLSE